MSKTVVGLFNTPAEAEKVKQFLIEEGYPPASIRSASNESDGFSEAAVAETTSTGSGETGVMASVRNFFHSLTSSEGNEQDYYTRGVSAGGALLAVTVADERVESVASLFETHGARDISEEAAQSGGVPAYATGSRTAAQAGLKATDEAIPIVEEELQVGKRQVQRGGVRVYSHIVETPVEEAVKLREEHVRVERTPVNRAASAADFETFKEGTIELTEMGEEAVVVKQARVVEEVTVGKDVAERTQTVKDTLRRTEVEIEEIPGEVSQKSVSGSKL
jgi:uncharacterized protein (TIGR02271 family)